MTFFVQLLTEKCQDEEGASGITLGVFTVSCLPQKGSSIDLCFCTALRVPSLSDSGRKTLLLFTWTFESKN